MTTSKDMTDTTPQEKQYFCKEHNLMNCTQCAKEIEGKTVQLDQIGTETLIALLSSRTKTEAAGKLQVHRNTVAERIDKYGLDKIMADIPKRALQTLQLGSDHAAETLVNALGNTNQRIEAAKEILNRVGLGGPKDQTGIAVKDGDKEYKIIVTRG